MVWRPTGPHAEEFLRLADLIRANLHRAPMFSGQIESAPTAYVDELADAAWAGLRGRPAEIGRAHV